MYSTSAHIWEAGQEQGKEEIEDDKIAHQDSGHEVWYASLPTHKDAVPHRFYPFSAQDTKHNHETGNKYCQTQFYSI